MKRGIYFGGVGLWLLSAGLGRPDPVTYPEKGPAFVVNVPKDWNQDRGNKETLDLTSPDGGCQVIFDMMENPGAVQAPLDQLHKAIFQELSVDDTGIKNANVISGLSGTAYNGILKGKGVQKDVTLILTKVDDLHLASVYILTSNDVRYDSPELKVQNDLVDSVTITKDATAAPSSAATSPAPSGGGVSIKFPSDSTPAFTFTLPDGWDQKADKDTLTATSANSGCALTFNILEDPEEGGPSIDDLHKLFFKQFSADDAGIKNPIVISGLKGMAYNGMIKGQVDTKLTVVLVRADSQHVASITVLTATDPSVTDKDKDAEAAMLSGTEITPAP